MFFTLISINVIVEKFTIMYVYINLKIPFIVRWCMEREDYCKQIN
jgi:hypothetical protein